MNNMKTLDRYCLSIPQTSSILSYLTYLGLTVSGNQLNSGKNVQGKQYGDKLHGEDKVSKLVN
jgi:hypothetical protein